MEQSHTPIELKSKYDIIAEIMLTYKYDVDAIESFNEESDCIICMESMNGTYVLKYPCKCVFHRNCVLSHVLIELKSNNLFSKIDVCPVCKIALKRI